MAAELSAGQNGLRGMICTLSSVLERVAATNDAARLAGEGRQADTAFNGLSKPSISLQSYMERILQYAECSPTCYVVAYIYLDRFVHRQPAIPIDSFSVHRFLITSVLTAVKFMDDIFYNNAYFAKVGGISLMEMNILELDFLFGMRFELNVTPAIFATYCSMLQREMHLQSPPLLSRLHCLSIEEEPSSGGQQKQLTA